MLLIMIVISWDEDPTLPEDGMDVCGGGWRREVLEGEKEESGCRMKVKWWR